MFGASCVGHVFSVAKIHSGTLETQLGVSARRTESDEAAAFPYTPSDQEMFEKFKSRK